MVIGWRDCGHWMKGLWSLGGGTVVIGWRDCGHWMEGLWSLGGGTVVIGWRDCGHWVEGVVIGWRDWYNLATAQNEEDAKTWHGEAYSQVMHKIIFVAMDHQPHLTHCNLTTLPKLSW